MKKKTLLIVALFLSLACTYAETIVLRTGTRVKGTILFQNDEVLIVRDAEGARFQYPRTEVLQILTEEEEKPVEQEKQENTIAPTATKKASILIELAGGAAVQPKEAAGGGFSADLLVGSHHIKDRHIFVGAGLGYHGLFLGAEKYNFLPIQAAVRLPLTEQKHAPLFGASIGYGIALAKQYKGGLYAGLDFGYRYQINPKSALAIVAFAQFQQATLNVVEEIEIEPTASGDESAPSKAAFNNTAGRNLLLAGLKLALYF